MTLNIIKESARGYQSLQITDVLMQERKIFLVEQVSTETCSDLIKQLLFLENEAPGEEIKLYINSPGGDVHSGLAVYDCIRLISSPVTTICIGTAASMGAILYIAGEKRIMLPHSRIMIHDPSFSGGNLGGKKPLEIQTELQTLIDVRTQLCDIIAERTGKAVDEIYEVTKTDTYFNADEAIDFGLATEIINKL